MYLGGKTPKKGSSSEDAGYGSDKITKQEYHWLNRKNNRAARIFVPLFAVLTPKNNSVKSPRFGFCQSLAYNNEPLIVYLYEPFVQPVTG